MDGMKLRAAIFDMDGTILDSMHIWEEVSVGFLRLRGIEPKPSFKEDVRMMTLEESAQFAREEYGIQETVPEIIESIYNAVREFYRKEAELKPGAREFLQKLSQAHIPMCVATATDRPFAEMALERLGIAHLFDALFTCTEIGAGKNRPDIFLAAASKMNIPPENTMVFEDSYPALVTAKAEGFLLCGVWDKMSTDRQAELREISHLYITDFYRAAEEITSLI